MNAFHIVKTVSADDLDDLNHVNNVVYVKWIQEVSKKHWETVCLLYTSPSPRDRQKSRMPSSA